MLRPCIVAGPDAQLLLRQLPPRRCRLPDPGTPFQLVHHDDVADALVAATLGKGTPGAYNLAADGTITLGDLARATGRLAFPVPRILLGPAALAARAPLVPDARAVGQRRARAGRDGHGQGAARAGWQPRYSSREILGELVSSQT